MIATDYAQALWQLKEKASIPNLRAALKRRGHQKLLPAIFAEYQKLELAERRLAAHKKVTPGRERTRVLLELYTRLINS